MTEQRTPWFPPDVHPVRPGWYERRHINGSITRDAWSGVNDWYGEWMVPVSGFLVPADHGLPWRGLIRTE